MAFPYRFVGGLSIFGLIAMGLYYYDQKHFRKADSTQWHLRDAFENFKGRWNRKGNAEFNN